MQSDRSENSGVGEEERWVAIPGFEGYYEVSDLGNVRSLRRKGSRRILPIKPGLVGRDYKSGKGYLAFTVRQNSKSIRVSVHRAVALAFLGPIPEGYEVNHKNGCPQDNRLPNLEIVTRSGNQRHSYEVLGRDALCGQNVWCSKLTDDEVATMRWLAHEHKIMYKMLAKWFGVADCTVSLIVRGIKRKRPTNRSSDFLRVETDAERFR